MLYSIRVTFANKLRQHTSLASTLASTCINPQERVWLAYGLAFHLMEPEGTGGAILPRQRERRMSPA